MTPHEFQVRIYYFQMESSKAIDARKQFSMETQRIPETESEFPFSYTATYI